MNDTEYLNGLLAYNVHSEKRVQIKLHILTYYIRILIGRYIVILISRITKYFHLQTII